MNNFGQPVIGLGIRTPEYSGLPLQWMPHFQVSDVAASAATAIALGGSELWHLRDDDGQSQWAVLADEFGAAFGVIPVVPEESATATIPGRSGCIDWLSLTVPDAASSRDFYQQVVGWSSKSNQANGMSEPPTVFEMLIDANIFAAEIRQAPSQLNALPSVWLIHLPVDDLPESLRRVSENGGQVIEEFTQTGSAVVRDPVGVLFALCSG